MAAVDVGIGGDAWFVFHNIGKIQQAFFENLILCIEQPLFTLRVVGGYGPVKCRKEYEACFFFFFRHDLTSLGLQKLIRVLSEL